MSLFSTEYLSSAVNTLTNSPNILQSLRETFSDSIAFRGINKYGKGVVVQISTVFRSIFYVTCQRVL